MDNPSPKSDTSISSLIGQCIFILLVVVALTVPSEIRTHILTTVVTYTSNFAYLGLFVLIIIEAIGGFNIFMPAGNLAFLSAGRMLQQDIITLPLAIIVTVLSCLIGYAISFGFGYIMRGKKHSQPFKLSKALFIFTSCLHPNIGSYVALGYGTAHNIDLPSTITFGLSTLVWNATWLYAAFKIPQETLIKILTDTRILIAYLVVLLALLAREIVSIYREK